MADDPIVDSDQPMDPEVQPADPPADEPTGDPVEEVGFNEKQLQQMFSATGRIVKKQIEDTVMPMLHTLQPQNQPPKGDALDDLNQNYQARLFEGDIVGVVNDVVTLRDKANTSAQGQKAVQTKQAIASLSDRPYYKETYPEIESLTQQYIAAGYPVPAAADAAYERAKGQHLEQQLTGGGTNLAMSGGGSRTVRTRTPTLKPEYKKAAQRDIDSGLYANEKEWIAGLSPNVRARAVT